jgi:outer membrane beta-barrel protein
MRTLTPAIKKVGACLLASAALLGATAVSRPAAAQEIQMTGPLAGAPSVRKLRLYREGRLELAPGLGGTLLDEYKRSFFVTARLQYNVFDWLGIGVFGGYAVVSQSTDLTDKIDQTAPRVPRTAVNLPAKGSGKTFADQAGKLKFMAVPQVTFSPFRGKLALFQKLFVDTDLYVHGGVAFVGVEERKDCSSNCNTIDSFATESRIAIAPSFGLGLTLYTKGMVSFNIEYRAFPFSWNRGGFDTRGAPPDASFPDNKITNEDRTFKFNQMIGLSVGFSLPSAPKLSD